MKRILPILIVAACGGCGPAHQANVMDTVFRSKGACVMPQTAGATFVPAAPVMVAPAPTAVQVAPVVEEPRKKHPWCEAICRPFRRLFGRA